MKDEKLGEKTIIIHADPEIQELIPTFLENRHKDARQIFEALKQNDFEKIGMLGHSMKGAGSGYGFDRVTEIGALIETSAGERQARSIEKLTEQLLDYLDHIKVIYE